MKFKKNDIIVCKDKYIRPFFIDKIQYIGIYGYSLINLYPYHSDIPTAEWNKEFIEKNYELASKLMILLYV